MNLSSGSFLKITLICKDLKMNETFMTEFYSTKAVMMRVNTVY